MTTSLRNQADDLARATMDAYSFKRYGFGAWRAACAMLLKRGYSTEEVETIMRSKVTRVAADDATSYYRATSADLVRCLDTKGGTQYIEEMFAEAATVANVPPPTPMSSRVALRLVKG